MLQVIAPRPPHRILMTTDAVGGVWRYSLDLARGLAALGVETVLCGFGPAPDARQRREAGGVADLHWSPLPLDWMAGSAAELRAVPERIAKLAHEAGACTVQVNLPTQAAGLETDRPVVAVSHSCVAGWFRAVQGTALPADWDWHRALNADGFARADAIVAPSRSHAEMLARCHPLPRSVDVVPNGARPVPLRARRERFAYAAGRWWDAGKNATVLDAAAALCDWPVLAFGATQGPRGACATFRHLRPMGPTAHPALRETAARAGIFVSPSLYEPFGLAALEAAHAGAALVLADIPTYRELWAGAASFADPHDPRALASAIDRLAWDPALREGQARAARTRAGRFTLARQAARMSALHAALARQPEGI